MIPAEELASLASGDHADPHRVLGPHPEGEDLVIRALRPDASEAWVIPDAGGRVAMRKIHDGCVFEARFPKQGLPFTYQIEAARQGASSTVRDPYSFGPVLGELDVYLVGEGTHLDLHRRLGARPETRDGVSGVAFAVWAPAARRVSVTGNFNRWDGREHPMRRLGNGIWELFIPGLEEGAVYKLEVKTPKGTVQMKSDPFGRFMELRPNTASIVTAQHHEFQDADWMAGRGSIEARRRPISIYEVHLGSWRKKAAPPGKDPKMIDPVERFLTYRELGDELVDHVADLGFTHIELLPVMEHPFDGSWGYQVTGYFAPTSRYGSPDDLRYFIDRCHQKGIGVILDWVPAHFPKDASGLGRFDGTHLYEHPDPRRGEHMQWGTFIFDYGRPEVRNFLISSALYWLEEFHADGLRVDAVASLLYLDFASNGTNWAPNEYGGRENLEAVQFIKDFNDAIKARCPGAFTCAEESSTWPGVTKPSYVGGLGFDFKWNMGWMHDTLDYFAFPADKKAEGHGKITFGLTYAFNERYVLPLSHDEVVHLKKSMLTKMAGDGDAPYSAVRALYAHMWAHPGKKLVFMGAEIGQKREWNFEGQLDWELLSDPKHGGLMALFRDLNRIYREQPALYQLDDEQAGFKWIDADDAAQSVVAYVRFPSFLPPKGQGGKMLTKSIHVVVAGNFRPEERVGYRIGVPRRCAYLEILNTDSPVYGGKGIGNMGRVEVEAVPAHGFEQSIVLTLPGLSVLWLVPEVDEDPAPPPPPPSEAQPESQTPPQSQTPPSQGQPESETPAPSQGTGTG